VRISRVRKQHGQEACLHARLTVMIYDEQHELGMRNISSLLIRKAESEERRKNGGQKVSGSDHGDGG
jgi:hypothetical protein